MAYLDLCRLCSLEEWRKLDEQKDHDGFRKKDHDLVFVSRETRWGATWDKFKCVCGTVMRQFIPSLPLASSNFLIQRSQSRDDKSPICS